jgi:hypothetical protein
MASTFKCTDCECTVRVSEQEELDECQQEHSIICKGKFVSIWKDYDKMSREEIHEKAKNVLFKKGVLKGVL